MAELMPAAERPFPPGDYPIVVVGSGPGGLQLAYALDRLGADHAVISADPAPGGMFRRWPFFQRLLSWTKPYAPAERGTPRYERYDWNSLLADEPEHRGLMPEFMDGSSYFPSRPEMERNLATFADRTGVRVRYGTRWTATRVEESAEGERFVVETTDGEYRTPTLVLAVGVAEPYVPPTPGLDLAHHYADTRPAESYAGRRVFIVGKQNSGFELASGLLPWARQIVVASPSHAKLSVVTKSLVGVRARYVQPFEDHALGGGVTVLDAAIDHIERSPEGAFTVQLRRTDGSGEVTTCEADDVIAATGFVTPLLDLPALGVATFGQNRVPAQTAWWESATRPGIFFAGTISQGAAGLKKHGLPANSGAVHGARYNARVLARHLAARLGVVEPAAVIPPAALADRLTAEVTSNPALWHQKAYLAWVAEADRSGGYRDAGIQPLAHALDVGGPDAVILTVETDASGETYPVVYLRTARGVEERVLDGDLFLDFGREAHRRELAEAVRALDSAAAVA